MTAKYGYCPTCGSEKLKKNGPGRFSSKTDAPIRQNYRCKDCGKQTIVPVKSPSQAASKQFSKKLPSAKRYLITAAQNATPVDKNFFASCVKFCDHNGAELIVIPYRYKNPTSHWSESARNAEYWKLPDDYKHCLIDGRSHLNSNLLFMGDIKTQAAAGEPLRGFDSISEGCSGIVGHSKIQMRCIPSPHQRLPSILTTTGVCTVPNYTDTPTGKKGEFHHTFGAVIVEIEDDKVFHMRHVNALKNGTFIDLWLKYTPDEVVQAPRAAALVMGDTHVRFIDPAVDAATFGKNSINELLDPQTLVWHDLLDGYSRNPHHRLNPFIEIAKLMEDMHFVREEVDEALDHIQNRCTKDQTSIIVPSNHLDFLCRYILDTDWRKDSANAEFYLETALAMVRSTKMTTSGAEYVDPFAYWGKVQLPDNFIFPARDDTHVIRGIEINQHGDRGPNGARGSIRNLRRIGVKSIIGHSHTPGIDEGCHQVGTSTHLKLEYNIGPSSWLNSHSVIYANGKRSHIHIIDGRWRIT